MMGKSLSTFGVILSRIDRRLYSFEKFLAIIGGLAIFSLMLLAVFSVGGRNMFNRPLTGYVDWIEQAMPFIAFIAISFVQRDGGHIRMDMVLSCFRGRFFWVLELFSSLLIFLLMLLLVWGSFSHFDRSFDLDAPLWSRDSSIDINLPLWPSKLLIPFAFSILCLRLLIQIFGCIRMIIIKDGELIAVPTIDDVATQASKQTEAMLPFESETKNSPTKNGPTKNGPRE